MKTFSIIILALIIGSSNAFAINDLPNDNDHLYKMRPPVKNLFFDTLNPAQDEVIVNSNNYFEAKNVDQSIVYENIYLTDNFTHNLDSNSDKISKIRDYALLMPEIIRKE